MKLPDADQSKARLRSTLRPQSKLGKTTLWFGVLAGVAEILQLIVRPAPGSLLSGWSQFLSFLFVCFLLLMGFRWVRQKLMWRLRNRLIVTYVFIGVIPVLLLVSMGLLAGYLFAGQFATYIALSDLQTELEHLESANSALTAQFRSLARNNSLTPQLAAEIASASDENFRQRTVTVLEGDKGYVISPGGRIQETQMKLPDAVKGDFSSFTMDEGKLHLRAVKHADAGGKHLVVISDVPVSSGLLQRTAAMVGAIEIYPPKQESEDSKTGKHPETRKKDGDDSVTIDLGGSHSKVTIAGQNLDWRVNQRGGGQGAPAGQQLRP